MRSEAHSFDAAICARIARNHARTFSLASLLLPDEKRRGARAVYAFCREADDLVDSCDSGPPSAAGRLDSYRAAATRAFDISPGDPVLRELVWAVHRFDVPRSAIDELLDGLARDVEPARYRTWDQLLDYCAGVASSVGEMCAAVFGVPGGTAAFERARVAARTLGLAMQLTNILRDVGEDARRGRCYLPAEDLALFGLTVGDVMDGRAVDSGDRWRSLMRFEIDRARELYAAAVPGIGLLAQDSQRCAVACATGYARILVAIERNGYDTIRRRAVVPRLALAREMARSWWGASPELVAASDPSRRLVAASMLAAGPGR